MSSGASPAAKSGYPTGIDEARAAQLRAANINPRTGLATRFKGRPLSELGREVVEIAHAGLRARKRLDGDGNDETIYMAPLDRAVASGLAPADELLAKWQSEWKGSFAPLFRDYAY